MDQDQKGRGAQPGFAVLSLRPNDAGARSLGQGSGRADHGEGLPEGERQRRVSSQCAADHVRRARHIQKVTGKQLESNYFTQTLLPDYLQETGVDWDVVYDARGHFNEPHGGRGFGVGTLEVRNYLAGFHDPELVDCQLQPGEVKTCGPSGNFGAVLFIEKEGFDPLLKAAKIAEKFDLAIMSTKGMSVTAASALADEMCHAHDIPLLLLHDFDKSRLLRSPGRFSATRAATNFRTASRPSTSA